jgi:predicted nucleic acid-binding protein
MILVDSSVWIEAIRNPHSPAFQQIEQIIEDHACSCGVIIQEVLQGLHDPGTIEEIYGRMSLLPYIEPAQGTYRAAAVLFQRCRREGIQIHTVDALIMALAIQHAIPVLTLDTDFTKVASLERSLRLHA